MVAFTTNDKDERDKLIDLAARIESGTGEHLGAVRSAANFSIDLEHLALVRINRGKLLEGDAVFNAELTLTLDSTEVDLRDNVPEQVAAQFEKWSRDLLAMAKSVRKVKPHAFRHEGRAHLLRDIATDELIESGAFYDVAHKKHLEHYQQTGRGLKIVTCPLAESPEAEEDLAETIRLYQEGFPEHQGET